MAKHSRSKYDSDGKKIANRLPLILELLLSLGLAYFLYHLQADRKVILGLSVFGLPVLVGIQLFLQFKRNGKHPLLQNALIVPLLTLFLISGYYLSAYTPADHTPFPSLGFCLSAGIPVAVVVYIKLIHPWVMKTESMRVFLCCVSILLTLLASCFLMHAYATHLNYILDTNPPQTVTTTIERKVSSGSRKHRSYYFQVQIGGKTLKLSVPGETYRKYNSGDPYALELYEGFFHAPFYLSSR